MQLLETLKTELLPQVQKPGQYLALEHGAYYKDWDSVKSRMAIIYPDLYELGMSNFGIKILYNIVNKHPDYLCDRAYGVMPDMEALLEERDLPLWGWESGHSLAEFDFLGFSLGYELCYPNIFTILKLPKIPFYTKDRDHSDPIIFAGGPAVFNPEPMAEFIDFFIVGDGEELITEVQDSMLESKREFLKNNPEIFSSLRGIVDAEAIHVTDELIRQLKNFPLEKNKSQELREKILFDLSQKQGIYVPRFYELDLENHYLAKPFISLDSSLRASRQNDDDLSVPFPVKKRVTQFLGDFNQPVAGPVPVIETVQDKQVLEIRRGCDRGCRFCQVGYTYLPVRERGPEDLIKLSAQSIKNTGYEDQTLLSLSASDYTCLTEVARSINDQSQGNGIGLSMPSQRADRFDVDLADEVSRQRKSGMTFAPEAGSERMRKIINKGLSQEEIFRAIKGSYEKGWSTIKLYFMVGLPFEEDSDLDGILEILHWSVNMSRELRKQDPEKYKKPIQINCTISTFVPKSFTAFQWFSQCSTEKFNYKHEYLRQGLKTRKIQGYVKLNCTDPGLALIEAVLSRGDRRWGEVVKDIWQSGSRYDSWAENFSLERWQKSAAKFGLDLHQEATRYREPGSKQCWDVLSIGFTEKFLLDEWKQAMNASQTNPCTENKCHACGVCFNLSVKNIVVTDKSDNNPFVEEIDTPRPRLGVSILVKNAVSSQPRVGMRQKLRLKISKLGDLRFISHLDFQRLFDRALRRSGLPLVYTAGFNKRIKINWLTAVPLFTESEGEYLELELAERYDNLEKLKEIFNKELPSQARILDVKEIPPGEKLSNQSLIEAVYLAELIQVLNSKNEAEENQQAGLKTEKIILDQDMVDKFLEQDEILIKKFSKGREKQKNLRPEIKTVKLIDASTLELNLNKTQRADEVLTALVPGSIWKVKKISQLLTTDLVLS